MARPVRATRAEGHRECHGHHALALAVRSGAKIFAEPAVLDRAGVSPEMAERVDTEEELGEGVEGEPGSALERAPGRGADRVVDPRLDVFRDFINSLGTDQDGESRGSG